MPMYKKSLLVLLVLVVAALGGTVYGLRAQESGETLDAGTAPEQTQQLVVYVTGAVQQPGVVNVPQGARIADAIEACGGLLPTADSAKINMAKELSDGQQVRVPEKAGQTAAGPVAGGKNSSGTEGGLVNINTADAQQLDTLPGVGPAMAQRIIEYREQNGGFQQVEDLKKIKGIGEAKFSKLKDKICI